MKGKDIDWNCVFKKASSYDGTLTSFCNENNISVKQYYYYRRKFNNTNTQNKESKVEFHAISLNETKDTNYNDSNIKIKIGNAAIYIPINNKELLFDIIKDMMFNV